VSSAFTLRVTELCVLTQCWVLDWRLNRPRGWSVGNDMAV
jgi:hypothetical protein